MKENYRKLIHKDFRTIAVKLPFGREIIQLASLVQVWLRRTARLPKEIKRRSFTVSGGGAQIPVEIFEPSNENTLLPCIFFIHGGGFGYEIAPHHLKLACAYALRANCRVVMPDYRLLPHHPFPAAYDDVMAAYKWLCENAAELCIDTDRIAVTGDSAGGALAANLCNNAKRAGLHEPCLQLLVYPVTDAGMSSKSMKKYSDTPGWNSVNNKKMWKMYLKGVPQEQICNASPMNNTLPDSLPHTYIETAEIDCLHDEGIMYAEKLRAAGFSAEVYETKGTIHGYDVAFKKQCTQKYVQLRIAAFKKAFEK